MTRRREIFTGMGVQFELGVEVGCDLGFATLLADYDAVFVGTGTYTYMRGGLENEDAAGVYDALDYLIGNTDQLLSLRRKDYPFIDLEGQRRITSYNVCYTKLLRMCLTENRSVMLFSINHSRLSLVSYLSNR